MSITLVLPECFCMAVIDTVTVTLHQYELSSASDWLKRFVWVWVLSVSLTDRFIVINGVSCHASLASRSVEWSRQFPWQTFMFYWSRQNTIKSPWADTTAQHLLHNERSMRIWFTDLLITNRKWDSHRSVIEKILFKWGFFTRATVN